VRHHSVGRQSGGGAAVGRVCNVPSFCTPPHLTPHPSPHHPTPQHTTTRHSTTHPTTHHTTPHIDVHTCGLRAACRYAVWNGYAAERCGFAATCNVARRSATTGCLAGVLGIGSNIHSLARVLGSNSHIYCTHLSRAAPACLPLSGVALRRHAMSQVCDHRLLGRSAWYW
jgi:hypothetical protein